MLLLHFPPQGTAVRPNPTPLSLCDSHKASDVAPTSEGSSTWDPPLPKLLTVETTQFSASGLAGGQNSAEQPGYEPGEMFEEGRPLAGRQSSQKNLLKKKKNKESHSGSQIQNHTHGFCWRPPREREKEKPWHARTKPRRFERMFTPRGEFSLAELIKAFQDVRGHWGHTHKDFASIGELLLAGRASTWPF